VANFGHFAKNTWEREYSIANSQFLKQKIFAKTEIFTLKSQNFATVAYHMKKECLRFSIFIFLISPNLAKCVSFCISRLEQHHKIENKK
jgi:hypothetical protein